MNSIVEYLRYLFIDKNQPLNKKDYITVLAFLYFLNVSAFDIILPNFLIVKLASQKSYTDLAVYSVLANFNHAMLWVSVPWVFLLLVGTFLVTRRIYGEKISLGLQLLSGLLVFLFFRGLIALPVYLSKISEFYSLDSELVPAISSNLNLVAKILFPFSFIGLLIVLFPIFKLKTENKSPDNNHFFGLDRGRFTRIVFYISFSGLALIAIFLLIVTADQFNNIMSNLDLQILLTGLSIFLIITHIILIILRIQNSGKSLFYLLNIFLFPALIYFTFFVLSKVPSSLLLSLAGIFVVILADLFKLFIFWLFLIPTKKMESNVFQ